MTVRNVSAWNPCGVRVESVRRPLYPTRPDPTRPFKWLRQASNATYSTRTRPQRLTIGRKR